MDALSGLKTKRIPKITNTQPGKMRLRNPGLFLVEILCPSAFIERILR
jgi:hypothetical protein